MKIRSIDTQIRKIKLKTPFVTALRSTDTVEFVRVTIVCENRYVGIGEAPATVAITGEGIWEIMHSIESIQDRLVGLLLDDALFVIHSSHIGNSAKAALDMAIVSLFAQKLDVPLFKYFGTGAPILLKTDVTISFNDVAKMLQDAKVAFEEGQDILKVKVGNDISHAVEAVTTISTQIPHATILVDANQAWNENQTIDFIQALKGFKIELIEQPVKADNLSGLKYITQSSHIPILADESVFSLDDVKFVVHSRCADMINIKLMKCGGVTKAVEILEYARAEGIKCMLGSMLEGPYSINIALHLAMAYHDVIKYIDLDSPLLYKEPSDELDFEFNGCEIRYKT